MAEKSGRVYDHGLVRGPIDHPNSPPKFDKDEIGRGTTDLVPGSNTTRLTYTESEVRVGGGKKSGA